MNPQELKNMIVQFHRTNVGRGFDLNKLLLRSTMERAGWGPKAAAFLREREPASKFLTFVIHKGEWNRKVSFLKKLPCLHVPLSYLH